MQLPPVIYVGSVKDVRGTEGVSPYVFEYSDRYSIFDWGQMPDLLRNKGAALAWLASFFFDYLAKQGLQHHMIGKGDEPRLLLVNAVKVLKPGSKSEGGKLTWDYSAYKARPTNALVPLEVIFRFGVPEGSSLLKRRPDLKAGDKFAEPLVEISTKLENKDRYISDADAQEISGMNAEEFKNLRALTALAATKLHECFAGIGVELWDGKFEFAFTEEKNGVRGLMLVDSIGPDELRLTMGGIHLSKELLRAQYKNSAWLAALEKAKVEADAKGIKEWKKLCAEQPQPLSADVREKAEMLYTSLCKALSEKYLGQTAFPEAWPLDQTVTALQQLRKAAA